MAIIIVFGKPGCGKTAFLTANAATYLNGSEACNNLFLQCKQRVSGLNDDGFNYTLPEHAPVYSNYCITVPKGYKQYELSYYIDGFHMGFTNDFVSVFNVYPGSKIFLSEAQRYYNSRNKGDKALPDWVSRFYEEHRHFGLDIWLDVQRPGLIDLNIREIAGRFVEVKKISLLNDANGFMVGTRFTVNEFDDWKTVDKYLVDGEAKGYVERVYDFPFNVFEYYVSENYFKSFLPNTDFDNLHHMALADAEQDLELAKFMYRQTAPEGFYKK